MSTANNNLSVPQEKGKKTRPKSPRRKAPTKPKKENDDATPVRKMKSKSSKEKNEDKSATSSVSPVKEHYASLLDEMVGRGDMVLLDPITEDKIIENLKIRYDAKDIYVSIEMWAEAV